MSAQLVSAAAAAAFIEIYFSPLSHKCVFSPWHDCLLFRSLGLFVCVCMRTFFFAGGQHLRAYFNGNFFSFVSLTWIIFTCRWRTSHSRERDFIRISFDRSGIAHMLPFCSCSHLPSVLSVSVFYQLSSARLIPLIHAKDRYTR
jgi:hypothetical protein